MTLMQRIRQDRRSSGWKTMRSLRETREVCMWLWSNEKLWDSRRKKNTQSRQLHDCWVKATWQFTN